MYPIKLLLVLLSIAAISCSKKEPEPLEPPAPPMLTEATQTGQHSLSFMLNDEVWVANTGWGDLSSSITVSSKSWRVSSERTQIGKVGREYFGMGLTLNEWSPYLYIYSDLDKVPRSNFSFGIKVDGCHRRYTTIPRDSFNVMNITHLETSQTVAFDQWISGTFQFRMVEEEQGGCGDTIYIRDGRFDLRYQAI